ncbi:putative NADH-flavin reductase [Bacillus pakistanensis]|uniref:NADH-flavin reductase n=1 Tax=Rossellomorea pakistanensis TaxID=992288 RepID=A0ABS2NEW8_9BACI|nr:SDR family oxidoreductase [Bacillus pakistanensis]MBM7586387.1 putative NADH-flavin reductase [Bacillus pakistanensis]
MKIALLGATGRVGSVVLENALQNNHLIYALTRHPEKLDQSSNLVKVKGTVLDQDLLIKTIRNCDAVISCLGTDQNNVLSRSTPYILNSMRFSGVRRIITIGTAGILQSRQEPSLYRFQSSESKRRMTRAAEDHLKAYIMIRESEMEYTVVCPTYLPEGERVGKYRTEENMLPEGGQSISVFDTGDFAYKQLFSDRFIRTRVGICY